MVHTLVALQRCAGDQIDWPLWQCLRPSDTRIPAAQQWHEIPTVPKTKHIQNLVLPQLNQRDKSASHTMKEPACQSQSAAKRHRPSGLEVSSSSVGNMSRQQCGNCLQLTLGVCALSCLHTLACLTGSFGQDSLFTCGQSFRVWCPPFTG